MKFFFLLAAAGLLLISAGRASAQIPAQPADPNQPIPAQPVQAPPAVPVVPTAPLPPTEATGQAPASTGPQVSILADGSLKAVLTELAQTWADQQEPSPQMPITLTNAGTMRAKIEAGGTWDLVLDVDLADVKAMTDHGQLLAGGQTTLARNTLMLFGRAPLVKDDDLDWFDLIGTEWKKVAVGNPELTASGRVAQRALGRHGLLDDDHKNAFVRTANESMALQLIQRDQADAAFAFKTDVAGFSQPGFQAYPIKPEDAPPLFYTAALMQGAKSPDLAQSFVRFCTSEAARPIWTKHGFETD